jgi:CRP-like cAMP-binding protein
LLLSDLDRAALLAAGRGRSWRAGEVLFRRGDPAECAVVLLAGSVKVHTVARGGTEVILEFSGAGICSGRGWHSATQFGRRP